MIIMLIGKVTQRACEFEERGEARTRLSGERIWIRSGEELI